MTTPTALSEVSAALTLADGRLALISNETGVWVAPSLARISEARRLSVPSLPEDCEGAAIADDGTVWITGSHSKSQPSREGLCHYTPDLRTLLHRYNITTMIKQETAWSFLRPFLAQLDIEGIAFSRGALLIGLRAPLIDGKAVILRIGSPNAKLIPGARTDLTYTLLNLGGLAIRDLAADPTSNRVLISAGGSTDGKATFHLRAVRADNLALLPLDQPLPANAHWEAILCQGRIVSVLADADTTVPVHTLPGTI